MELRAGYKRSDIGIIPNSWEQVNIASEADMITVGFVGSMSHLFTKGGVPLLRGQDVEPNKINISNTQFISSATHKLWSKSALKEGDVVITRVGASAGMACSIPTGIGEANAASLVIVRPTKTKLNPIFLSQLINSNFGKKQIESLLVGGAQPVINTATAANFQLALPGKREQDAIATALSDVDALLAKIDQLIAKKRDLKQAAMQQLLTGQTRLPGFSGEWEIVQAGDIGRFKGGSGFPTRFQGGKSGEFPFYKVSDMNIEGNEVFMSNANNYLDEGLRKQIGATAFPANSIVFAKVGAAVFLERKKILSQTSCIDNNMAALILDSTRAYFRFVHFVLLNTKLGNLVSTTALPSLSSNVLTSIMLTLPPFAEQTAIATVLSDMDAELAALEARRDKTRALKQGMMQALLTGRIRLIES